MVWEILVGDFSWLLESRFLVGHLGGGLVVGACAEISECLGIGTHTLLLTPACVSLGK